MFTIESLEELRDGYFDSVLALRSTGATKDMVRASRLEKLGHAVAEAIEDIRTGEHPEHGLSKIRHVGQEYPNLQADVEDLLDIFQPVVRQEMARRKPAHGGNA